MAGEVERFVAKLERLMAMIEIFVVKLERWVANLETGMNKL